MGLRDWIERRRHRRGFGVHSPLGFRVVKEVLFPDPLYRYYGEERLMRLPDGRRLARILRLEGLLGLKALSPENWTGGAGEPALLQDLANETDSRAQRAFLSTPGRCLALGREDPTAPGDLVLAMEGLTLCFSLPQTQRRVYLL